MSVLVVAQSSSEIPEGLMNNPVYVCSKNKEYPEDEPHHSSDKGPISTMCTHPQYVRQYVFSLERDVIFSV